MVMMQAPKMMKAEELKVMTAEAPKVMKAEKL